MNYAVGKSLSPGVGESITVVEGQPQARGCHHKHLPVTDPPFLSARHMLMHDLPKIL